jgi:hypothetical protein
MVFQLEPNQMQRTRSLEFLVWVSLFVLGGYGLTDLCCGDISAFAACCGLILDELHLPSAGII